MSIKHSSIITISTTGGAKELIFPKIRILVSHLENRSQAPLVADAIMKLKGLIDIDHTHWLVAKYYPKITWWRPRTILRFDPKFENLNKKWGNIIVFG